MLLRKMHLAREWRWVEIKTEPKDKGMREMMSVIFNIPPERKRALFGRPMNLPLRRSANTST